MPRCPRCGGILTIEYDWYEQYYTCVICARGFNLKGEYMRHLEPGFRHYG